MIAGILVGLAALAVLAVGPAVMFRAVALILKGRRREARGMMADGLMLATFGLLVTGGGLAILAQAIARDIKIPGI